MMSLNSHLDINFRQSACQSVSQPIIVSQSARYSQSVSCQSTKQSASQSYSQKATLASPISPFGEEYGAIKMYKLLLYSAC